MKRRTRLKNLKRNGADFCEKAANIRFILIPQTEEPHRCHATPKSPINWLTRKTRGRKGWKPQNLSESGKIKPGLRINWEICLIKYALITYARDDHELSKVMVEEGSFNPLVCVVVLVEVTRFGISGSFVSRTAGFGKQS